MSEPTPIPPTPAPRRPAPSRPAGRGRLLAVGVGGVALGAGLGLAGAGLFGLGGPDFAVENDALRAGLHVDYACALAERIDRDVDSPDDLGSFDTDPTFWEASALGYLLVSAALLDPQHGDLRDAGNEVIESIARLDVEELVTPAARACAER